MIPMENIQVLLIYIGFFFGLLIVGNLITNGLLINIIIMKIKKGDRVLIKMMGLSRTTNIIGHLKRDVLTFKFNKSRYHVGVLDDSVRDLSRSSNKVITNNEDYGVIQSNIYKEFGLPCITVDEFGNVMNKKGIFTPGVWHQIYENLIEEAENSNAGLDKNQKIMLYIIIGMAVLIIVSLFFNFQVYNMMQQLPKVAGAVI